MLELPVTEKLEEVVIEEHYYSEVCTVFSDVMSSTTVDCSDDDNGKIIARVHDIVGTLDYRVTCYYGANS